MKRSPGRAPKDKLPDDLLRPRSPRLRISRHHNIIVPKREPVPLGRIANPILSFPRLPRPLNIFHPDPPPATQALQPITDCASCNLESCRMHAAWRPSSVVQTM